MSISETIDQLAELGIEAPIGFEDYLKGFNVLKNLEGMVARLERTDKVVRVTKLFGLS